VSDGAGPSEFEMIVQFPLDLRRRSLTVRSDSKSEELKIFLNEEPVNKVQTAFKGARCAFEIKRLKNDEIEVYSSSLRNCASDLDYDVYPYLGVTIKKTTLFLVTLKSQNHNHNI
jgi:hypothetical protein